MIIKYSLKNIVPRRILILFATLCLSIVCLNAYSLSLGRIKIDSSLNQPLVASIEILNAEDVLCEEILPNLASDQDFKLAKLKQPDFLDDIEFEVVAETKSKKIIHISTETVIQNPSIDMLVEVHWPMGRILKEYSILLNPLSVDSEVIDTVKTNQVQQQKIVLKKAQATTKEAIKSKIRQQDDNLNTYYTENGDTLWAIAAKVKKEVGLSAKQTMEEIFKDNPDAFINNNRTQLKSGYKLILPKNNLKTSDAKKSTANNLVNVKPADDVVKSESKQLNPEPQVVEVSKAKLSDKTNKDSMQSEAELMKQQIAQLKKQISQLNEQKQAIIKEPKPQSSISMDKENQVETVKTSADTISNQQVKSNRDKKRNLEDVNPELEDKVMQEVKEAELKSGGFSFTLYLIIAFVILLIIGASFIYYRRHKKHSNVDNAESSNDEIVTDYSAKEVDTPENKAHNKVTNSLEQADEFIQKKEHDKAVLILNQALSISPNDPEINIKLLELYCNISDAENAKKILENCVNIKNEDLNKKLNSLKAMYPDIFSDTAIGDGRWGVDDNDVALSILDAEEDLMDDPSEKKEGKADELSFLEDSDFMDETIIDEIVQDDSPSLSVSAEEADTKNAEVDTENAEEDSENQGSKLDLAKGYIEMADYDEANKLLEEIIKSGSEDEQQQAEILLKQIEDQQ